MIGSTLLSLCLLGQYYLGGYPGQYVVSQPVVMESPLVSYEVITVEPYYSGMYGAYSPVWPGFTSIYPMQPLLGGPAWGGRGRFKMTYRSRYGGW